jgi:predicted Zn-dependent protease
VGGILLGLIIICAVVILFIPRLIDRINPFNDVQDLISPIETAIGPINLTSIPQQIDTAIPLELTGLPLDIPSEFPVEIPTLSPITIPGLGIELPHLTDEEEIEIGREAAAEFETENRLSRDPALVQRVEQIGSALVPHSQRRNIEYTFKVVDTVEVNAFALPGGYIYVTRGMVEFVEQDHELAGVIGHEIAHVALRHGARLIENLAAAQAAIDLVTASSEEIASIYQDNATQLAINAVTQIVVSGWGRENELDADQHGTIYMARAGYNPYKIIDLFERMGSQEAEPGDPLALMFATHPPFPDRIRRVRETIQEYRLG